ncbi:MAG: nucleotidyltransferase family protein [Gammaproteobacteria bacterium]|nr:nucleotidyltransferase family protein [Gammaproteobacteria bacterium]
MTSATLPLLVEVLRDPTRITRLGGSDLDLLIRQGRAAQVLGTLRHRFHAQGLLSSLALGPRNHLDSAWYVAERLRQNVIWETHRICDALYHASVPVVVLKGGAYVLADLDIARGRTFNDIDILVPKSSLERVERDLRLAGWISTAENEYDQRYYRQWMHELPPMRHLNRLTVIDVHHAILPETARLHPDSEALLASAEPLDMREDLFVLEHLDMVLHSACHLFHEGEFNHGLRDLLDIDGLLRMFQDEPAFWERLQERAATLMLTRPLFYALKLSKHFFDTPTPEQTLRAIEKFGPRGGLKSVSLGLFERALAPTHPSCDGPLSGVSRAVLYIRSHYLRMPPRLLIPHLVRKSFRGQEP